MLRRFVVDSGASLHLVGMCDLTAKEKSRVRQSSTSQGLQTAGGIVRANQ